MRTTVYSLIHYKLFLKKIFYKTKNHAGNIKAEKHRNVQIFFHQGQIPFLGGRKLSAFGHNRQEGA
jgi:hypothetical protein